MGDELSRGISQASKKVDDDDDNDDVIGGGGMKIHTVMMMT